MAFYLTVETPIDSRSSSDVMSVRLMTDSILPKRTTDATYYVRAWGRESGKLIMGEPIQFQTSGFAMEILPLVEVPDSALFLQGVLHKMGQCNVSQVGFKWSQTSSSPDQSGQSFSISPVNSDTLSHWVFNWNPLQPYYYCSFAVGDQNTHRFSRVLSTEEPPRISTGTIYWYDTPAISGLNLSSTVIGFARPFEFGHCWTNENRLPTIDDFVVG